MSETYIDPVMDLQDFFSVMDSLNDSMPGFRVELAPPEYEKMATIFYEVRAICNQMICKCEKHYPFTGREFKTAEQLIRVYRDRTNGKKEKGA